MSPTPALYIVGMPILSALICAVIFVTTRRSVFLNLTMAFSLLGLGALVVWTVHAEGIPEKVTRISWQGIVVLFAGITAFAGFFVALTKLQLSMDKKLREKSEAP